jgi:hypothetical protein
MGIHTACIDGKDKTTRGVAISGPNSQVISVPDISVTMDIFNVCEKNL